MDRFRSGGAGSTATVEAQFTAEIEATQSALRASAVQGKKQQRTKKRHEQQHQKYEKEHKVAAWDVRKSGNPWMAQDGATRILRKEEMLDAVEGQYREPVRPRARRARAPQHTDIHTRSARGCIFRVSQGTPAADAWCGVSG
jgi:hypothetical protein